MIRMCLDMLYERYVVFKDHNGDELLAIDLDKHGGGLYLWHIDKTSKYDVSDSHAEHRKLKIIGVDIL